MADSAMQPTADITVGKKTPTPVTEPTRSLSLDLVMSDSDSIAELLIRPEGRQRNDYALAALRIGLLSLKHARGQVDADLVKHEGDKLLKELGGALESHRKQVNDSISATLKEYFDSKSQRFQERVDRLIQKDGELEQLLRRQIGGEDSELTKTLAMHVGGDSSLMKILDPAESEGLVQALSATVKEIVENESKSILTEFSLDNRKSALSRLVVEISGDNGRLKSDLAGQVEKLVKEFSADKEDSALNRLMKKVDQSQEKISKEFSMDDEDSALFQMTGLLQHATDAINTHLTLDTPGSALARLRRELVDILAGHEKRTNSFQTEVTALLEAMKARRQESLRSTTHGRDFEDVTVEFIYREAEKSNDVPCATGTTTGNLKGRKVGDAVVELGSECAAGGEKYVLEAKEDATYDISKARPEIETARQNRGAIAGLFVFSRKTAPAGQEPLIRHGNDVFVIWDAEDTRSDVNLKAGMSLAKALCVRQHVARRAEAADFQSLDAAILAVETEVNRLVEIKKLGQIIRGHSGKILEEAQKMEEALEQQIRNLKIGVIGLKQTAAVGTAT
ncbi:MAG TPA: hypothetical protein VGK01_15410 [Candidatus Angelobacter sp.]